MLIAGCGSGRVGTRLAATAVGPQKKCEIHSGPCENGAKADRVHAPVRAANAVAASQASELSASMAYMSLEGTGCTSLVRTVNAPIPTRAIAAAAQMNGVDQRAPSHSASSNGTSSHAISAMIAAVTIPPAAVTPRKTAPIKYAIGISSAAVTNAARHMAIPFAVSRPRPPASNAASATTSTGKVKR
jgi:hypothetical protein